MVTRTVIRVTSPEAAETPSSAAADSIIKNAATQSTEGNSSGNRGGKKRAHPSSYGDTISGEEMKRSKRNCQISFLIELSDVPPQPPIPKSEGRMKEGASKYTGVSFNKAANKWQARIKIDGKNRNIGYYESEEEAAIDYARAVFKYKGQEVLDKVREQPAIDLSDVPPQSPIPKSTGLMKEGTSKYRGVSFQSNKWQAQIMIAGKDRYIGRYENEEEAAVDYARAVFKYKGQDSLDKAREREISVTAIKVDLSDVPPQLPIPSKGQIKEGASKYKGVSFNKERNKWRAEIKIDGKQRYIGRYENEEEAAVDYARAVFKFKGQDVLDKARKRNSSGGTAIDLSDVLPQPPIPKSKGRVKEGASQYTGVTFDKARNKWKAETRIEGKVRYIGYYENEEDAAIDYARAVFKYKGKGQEALDKSAKGGLPIEMDN